GHRFADIVPIFRSHPAATTLADLCTHYIKSTHGIATVYGLVCLEGRGQSFKPLIPQALGILYIPVGKKGKLPNGTVCAT
ncbi:uncharacterized protein BDZ99DRAFT_375879, partial [Mytilinidion resinicola]